MIYSKIFTRDFSLVNMEVWHRAESTNKKAWTDKKQPYLPYIVSEKKSFVDVYYCEKGLAWTKQEAIRKAHTSGFLAVLEKEMMKIIAPIRKAYEKELALDYDEFIKFLDCFEKSYSWFEVMWFMAEEVDKIKIDTAPIARIRKATERYAPGTEQVIRNSIKKCFPKVADYAHVISGDEIRSKKIPSVAELKRRDKGFFLTDNKLFVGKNWEFIKKEYDIRVRQENKQNYDADGIKGLSAYPGKAKGTVKVLMSFREVDKVKKGDIIVASMTMPDVMSAMKKAAAIVTDEGGMLCHAAITSRELKIPCIVGTKIATQVLKDGDYVEVDANNGIVRRIT